jgi:hypothetical protein
MRNVWTWLVKPQVKEGSSPASMWRLRVWAGVLAMFVTLFMAMHFTPLVVLLIVALIYWIYAVARMIHARVRGLHIPSRDDIRERYLEDPERDY